MNDPASAVLILTHGRPGRVATIASLRRGGYTGRIILVLDDLDATRSEYLKHHPDEEVVLFEKDRYIDRTDSLHNAREPRSVVYARNAAYGIARDLKLDRFVVLDDDYLDWHHRVDSEGHYLSSCSAVDLDAVFDAMFDFLDESGADCVALAQGGDLLGGASSPALRRMGRKLMNAYFFRTDHPVEFLGTLNDDVNTYVSHGSRGALFATVAQVHLNQVQTQASEGGLTDIYLAAGTYTKSMMTVMLAPSCVRVALMGSTRPRLHHVIDWNHAAPKIISEEHRKAR